MRSFRLIAVAATATSLAAFISVLGIAYAFDKFDTSANMRGATALIVLFTCTGTAGLWLYQRLRTFCPEHVARAGGISFAVFAPIALAVGIVLAELSGALVESLLGSKFAFAGAISGLALVTTLVSYLMCSISMWIIRTEEHLQR